MARKANDYGARGEDHRQAKLTWDDVRSMRRRFESGDATQNELAEEYGMSRNHIGAILRYQNWYEPPED